MMQADLDVSRKQRIVAKVAELMGLTDRLERHLVAQEGI